ncbi:hypothetical protein CFP56_022238 [Quercus suber]|uniref:RNase H type-1 domain-containing protein n=1 Tax=Quercus suber TaxID=58331 RepID=A0AAW0KCH7_QUESU
MVLLDDGCDHCHDEPEDMLHALWSCPSISQTPHIDPWPIWKPPPWPKLKVNFDGVVFREIQCVGLGAVVRNAEGSVLASMAESFHLPLSVVVVEKARSLFVRNAQPHPPDQTPHIDPWPIWKPPPWPKLKVNFDGVVFREIQCAGLEAVVRNAEGSVLASMAESFHLPLSVVVVEVIAAKKAF